VLGLLRVTEELGTTSLLEADATPISSHHGLGRDLCPQPGGEPGSEHPGGGAPRPEKNLVFEEVSSWAQQGDTSV
jgi:hypothetical protein